jgi:hypothetical protein
MEPSKVSRKRLHDDPAAIWNEFVHLLAMSKDSELTEIQRVAHLVFWYEHEVQNGGHLQYFENRDSLNLR